MDVQFIYGKHLWINNEQHFWAIFKSDERVQRAHDLSMREGVENGLEILSEFPKIRHKVKTDKSNLISTNPKQLVIKEKNKGRGGGE